MLKIKPSDRNQSIESPSMRLMADFLKVELVDSDKIAEAITPLDKSIAALPDSYGVKDKLEEMLYQTITLSKQNGESSYRVFSMCAGIIAGATTVVACFVEGDDDDA